MKNMHTNPSGDGICLTAAVFKNAGPARTCCVAQGTLLQAWMGGELEENGYVYVPPECLPATVTALLISNTPI